MKKNGQILILCLAILALSGCASVCEPFRVVWGSSIRALEKARANSVKKTFHCSPDQCFDHLLASVETLQKEPKSLTDSRKTFRSPLSNERTEVFENTVTELQVFLKDRRRQVIVLMGIPGSVDTTEVGIFFNGLTSDVTEIEISSLSRQARDTTAQLFFPRLEQAFGETPANATTPHPGETPSS